MTSIVRTAAVRWRRLVPAALLAAGAILGGSAVGDLAVAGAAPEWDIGRYDECLDQWYGYWQRGEVTAAQYQAGIELCCINSGGVWKKTGTQGSCQSPPANAAGRTVPPGVIAQTLTPAPATAPPGDITQTLTPAP
jgi:hypothetical protein